MTSEEEKLLRLKILSEEIKTESADNLLNRLITTDGKGTEYKELALKEYCDRQNKNKDFIEIFDLIKMECEQQNLKWGIQNHEMCKWMNILMEEVGESSREALNEDVIKFKEEMIQVAAVATQIIDCINRNKLV